MQLIQAIVLGLVQGFTEFIPISSSGHLIIAGHLLKFGYSGLAFDTALDIGTLIALLAFFWRDFWNMAHDFVMGGKDRKLASYIILATLPAVIAGILIQSFAETVFRSDVLVAFNFIWVAALMLIIDRGPQVKKKLEQITFPEAFTVGLAQVLALVPGVSRSGSTILAGRALKLDRVTATRFSFLLSAPVIAGATLKVVVGGNTLQEMAKVPMLYLSGILAAFVAGYISIKFLLNYLSKHGLAIFAYYRILVGVLILLYAVAR